MPLITWNDKFSVNVAEIDREHKRLIQLINELNEAMIKGKGKTVIREVLMGLTYYTQTHFKTEEKYFEQFGYPTTAAHKAEHGEFIKKITEFNEQFNQGKTGLSVEVLNYLWGWLQTHIQQSDRAYSSFFNEKGLH